MVESVIKEDQFLIEHSDFLLKEKVVYPNGGISSFYENGTDMVIIDDGICDIGEKEAVFSYMLITDKQNHYMHQYRRVFRFLGYLRAEVDKYLKSQDLSMVSDCLSIVSTSLSKNILLFLDYYSLCLKISQHY